jgi:CRP-like cAMP-binding protein
MSKSQRSVKTSRLAARGLFRRRLRPHSGLAERRRGPVHPINMHEPGAAASAVDDEACSLATLSSALLPIFRGRFCDLLLPGRATATFEHNEVLYERGDSERCFFFVLSGVVKTGTITRDGREIVYDLRKERDVIGELCAFHEIRRDRAVALARTVAVEVPFDEVIAAVARHGVLLHDFIGVFCGALAQAYDHIDSLAFDTVLLRTTSVLRSLARKFGHPAGESIELPMYLTQEDLAQMVAARRERVSTALNNLRRAGIVHYSPRGHLRLNILALDSYHLSDAAAVAH